MTHSHGKFHAQAEQLLAEKRYEEALDIYNKVCASGSGTPHDWLIAGSLAGHLGKFDNAEMAFRKALDLQPGSLSAYYNLAQALEAQGRYSDAIDILMRYREQGSADKNSLLRLGILHGKAGDFRMAIDWLEKYSALEPDDAHGHHCLAYARASRGENEEAGIEYRKAIALNPSDSQLHNNYGAFLQTTGNWNDAITHYNEAIRLNPGDPTAFHNLASAFYALGAYSQALAYYNKAIKLKPDYAEAYVGLGRSYRSIGDTGLAIRCYKKAISIDEKCINAYTNLGYALVTRGLNDAAMDSYMAVLEHDAGNIQAICGIAALHERRSNYQKARETISPLLESAPCNKDVAITYGAISRKFNTRDAAISNLNKALLDISCSPVDKSSIHYMLGKLYDDIGDYDNAFANYKAANDLVRFDFDGKSIHDALDKLTCAYSSELFPGYAVSENRNYHPIFIVGMPRSGTTLVEQIISSHPAVCGAGELPYIQVLANGLQQRLGTRKRYPENAGELTVLNLNELSSEYMQLVSESMPGCMRFSDKMPHNFIHLGFIKQLFPNATIIHCTRNPLDTCLSIYFHDFTASHPYASSLENTASYYTDYYQGVMAHWNNLPGLQILEVNYESLVENQEAVTRRLLEYCGLDWHEDCLRFHESSRGVATISYDQVRQPLYRKSMSRWKNYEKHIQPLLDHFRS